MAIQKHVKLINAALDEDKGGAIIIRGRLDPETLDAILIDDYQREILPVATINGIMRGFEPNGSVPDIDLGMRGLKTRDSQGVFTLLEDTYVIDGQQRITAAKRFLLQGKQPRLGATVHLGTTRAWEIERFRVLNSDRVRVASNVLIKNSKDEFEVIAALYNMSESDNGFPMKGRICWTQNKNRMHLITAATLTKVAANLHAHLGAGLAGRSRFDVVTDGLERLYNRIGRNLFKENVRVYFRLVEDCWGIRTVTYQGACHLRNTFMLSLAKVLSNHMEFWKDNKLFIEMDLVRKFAQFPVQDPTVQQLSGASGQAGKILYGLMVDHMNRGKRTRRLKPRMAVHIEEELPELAEVEE